MREVPHLERFVDAQAGGVFEAALAEIESGAKRGHWIWFVLPQLAGLGQSDMARRYGIQGLEEAIRYLRHLVLGPRLLETLTAILQQLRQGSGVVRIMGSPIDALKLVSSMTLFEQAAAAGEELPPSGFRAIASEILDLAQSRGFPRCARTLARLTESG